MGLIKSIGKFKNDFTGEVAHQVVLIEWITKSQRMGKKMMSESRGKGKYCM